jgi:ribosomal protein S12 methylthiotransferase
MAHQHAIALSRQETMVGKVLDVLVDGMDPERGLALCRSYREAPEVDGYVIVSGQHRAGDRLKVRVTAALPYDLDARLIKRYPSLERHPLIHEELGVVRTPDMPAVRLADITVR